MSNNKQSSVDWLIDNYFGGIENCSPMFRSKIAEAKAMHKEEIENIYAKGYVEGYKRALDYMTLSIEKQIKARQNEQQ